MKQACKSGMVISSVEMLLSLLLVLVSHTDYLAFISLGFDKSVFVMSTLHSTMEITGI